MGFEEITLQKGNRAESSHDIGLTFGWCSADYKRLDGPNSCKAYIQDYLQSVMTGSVYGRHESPLSLDKTRLLIGVPTKSKEKIATRMLSLLNQVEEKMGFVPTVIKFCKGKSVLYVEGDAKWMIAIPMLSMYTLLIRISPKFDGKKEYEEFLEEMIESAPNVSDRFYLKTGIKPMKNIARYGPSLYFSEVQKENFTNTRGSSHSAGIATLGDRSIATSYKKEFLDKKVQARMEALRKKGFPVES